MTTKHTPVQWRWWKPEDGRPKNYDRARLLSADGELILSMYGGAGKYALGRKPEDIANAGLIVAAPDYDHAARLVAGSAIRISDGRVVVSAEALQAIDAAIAKAEGEQP